MVDPVKNCCCFESTVSVVVPAAVAVVVYPAMKLSADRLLFPSHAAKDEAVGAIVALVTPVPPLAMGSVPVTPVVRGRPVPLVRTMADGVPRAGVTRVGLVERTVFPDPVEVVVPVPPLATGSVPVTPVVRGNPVALVSTTAEGVPSAGVTNVGLVDKTVFPDPVEVVVPVPPLATGRVPVTAVVRDTFVMVLLAPLIVLFVRGCVAADPTKS